MYSSVVVFGEGRGLYRVELHSKTNEGGGREILLGMMDSSAVFGSNTAHSLLCVEISSQQLPPSHFCGPRVVGRCFCRNAL